MKKVNKIVSALILFIILLMQFSNIILAATDVKDAFIEYDQDCGSHLEAHDDDEWYTILASYVEYEAPNGKKYPAYCLDNTKPGVGSSSIGDIPEGYDVKVEKILDNNKVYTAIINGYPYKTPSQLGVEDKYDAYMATKQAIYSVLYNYNVDDVYRGLDERGNKIKAAIKTIVEKARKQTQSPKTPLITFKKVGEFGEDSNKDYYSQTYSVTSDIDMKEYTITATAKLPEGSFIADTSGSRKTKFSAGENFKVMVPKDEANKLENLTGTISVQSKCKTYPVFYATKSSEYQPYALSFDPYGDNSAKLTLDFDMNTGKIVVNKTDSENSKPIEGVSFQLQKADGTVIANGTTNANGQITFSSLASGNYILKETSTDKNYVLNESNFDVSVEYNKTTTKNITNDIKKGQIKIIKVDLDENEIKLQGVEFKIYDEDGTLVDTLITDANRRSNK